MNNTKTKKKKLILASYNDSSILYFPTNKSLRNKNSRKSTSKLKNNKSIYNKQNVYNIKLGSKILLANFEFVRYRNE